MEIALTEEEETPGAVILVPDFLEGQLVELIRLCEICPQMLQEGQISKESTSVIVIVQPVTRIQAFAKILVSTRQLA